MAAIGTQSLSQLVKVNITQKTEFDIYKAITAPENIFLEEKFRPLSPQLEPLKAMAESAIQGGTILLSGTFGVGKTSLLALLGRLLSVSAPSEEFSATLSLLNDTSLAKNFSELRSGNRSWLVAASSCNKKDADLATSLRQALQKALLDKKLSFAWEADLSLEENCQKVSDYVRQNGYEGLLLLLDEADALVEKALHEGESPLGLESFCAFCRRNPSSILCVVATNTEISNLSLEEEERAIAVFSKVQSVSMLGRTGEWENFVSSSIIEHIKGELWDSLLEYKDFRLVTEGLIQSGLYKGSSEKWITETIMHGAYPLHPAVAFALPRVALAMSGPGRTAFNFFCDASPGGFLYFLRNFAIVQPNGRLHLYTLDSLFTYFEKTFSADPANSDYVKGLNKSVIIAGDVPQARRILRLTLLIQLIAHDRFKSTQENILWAMHLGEKEAKVAGHSLQLLKEKKALEFNEKTGEYTLPVERRKVTLSEALARMRNRVRSQLDVASVIKSGLAVTKIEAEDFNRNYYTDRFAGINVVLASEISDPVKFMTKFTDSLEQLRPYKGDISFVLVVAESEAELERVKGLADEGAFKHKQLIFALLKDSIAISKDALDALALERVCAVEIPFCDPTSVEYEKAQELLNETKERLEASVAHVVNTENLLLYHNGQVHTELDLDATCELVNNIITSLIGQPPMLSNGDLLSLHESSAAKRSRQSLIAYILGCRGPIALRSHNRNFINIIQSAFVETGLLESERAKGGWHYFHLVREEAHSQVAEGYAFLCSQILAKPGSISCIEADGVIKSLTKAPYGFTPSLIELLLALAFWQYRDYLVLHKNLPLDRLDNSEEVAQEVAISARAIFDLVSNPAGWAFVFTDCTSEQLVYLQGISDLCSDKLSEDKSLWKSVGRALLDYYRALSKYSRSAQASGNEEAEKLRSLLEKVSSQSEPSYRLFLERQIPALFGYGEKIDWSLASIEIVSKLKESLQKLANIPQECYKQIGEALRSVFAPYEGEDGESSWATYASNWYQENSALFQDNSRWRNELEALKAIVDCHNGQEALAMALKTLHYPPVEEWSSYNGYEIIESFQAMRQDIEWGSYRCSCVLPSPTAAAYGVAKSVLVNSHLQNLEDFLTSELEWAVWPEKILHDIRETDDIADYGDLSEWSYRGGVSEKIRLARLQESAQPEAENIGALLLLDDEVEDEDEFIEPVVPSQVSVEVETPSPEQQPAAKDAASVAEPEEVVAEAKEPAAEPEEVAAEAKEPAAEPEEVVAEAKEPAAEPEEVAAEAKEPATEPEEVVAEAKEPAAEPEEAVVEAKEPVVEDVKQEGDKAEDEQVGRESLATKDEDDKDSWAKEYDLDESALQWL